MVQIIHNDDTIKVAFDNNTMCLFVQWNSYCCGEIYRQYMEDILIILKSQKAKKLLLNQSNKDMYYKDDTSWIWDVWLCELFKIIGNNGKLAVVLSKYFNTITLTQGTCNKFFTNSNEALNWLSS